VRLTLAPASSLAPLTELLADPSVTEVLCNGPGSVWVERAGRLDRSAVMVSAVELQHLIERILAPLGRRADRSTPWAEGRLADGSRVHVVVPPIAVDGPYIPKRLFRAEGFALADFADGPTQSMLRAAVHSRSTILVIGPAGAGKTTLVNTLAGLVAHHERVVTIEDAAELHLDHPHVVRLEARPPNGDHAGEVPLRELVRTALRLRPDRLVIGEIRGPEALDLLQALHTGHQGSFTTLHAVRPTDAMHRLEALVLSAAGSPPLHAVRSMLDSSIDLVVRVERDRDGRRRVVELARVSLDSSGRWCSTEEQPCDS
jgi:pilus assembly protein CpaF